MKILRIKSHSTHEALAEARRQLGDDVTVLHTKRCIEPGPLGVGQTESVEILVGVDTLPSAPVGRAASVVREAAGTDLGRVAEQISDIRETLASLKAGRSVVCAEPSPVAQRLQRNGVSSSIAELIGNQYKSVNDSIAIISDIARRITVSGAIDCANQQARVVLVGPTGVGKTTTIAKLAAEYTHLHKKKVALITLDTYRIAAVEQLATYARILGIPLETVLCPEDADAAIRRHADKDLILVDTVGRSQRNRADLVELAVFVRATNPTETHLVVAATSSAVVQKEAVECFRMLNAEGIILTKLDETPQSGCILDLAAFSLMPYSYVTFGQEVPSDISLADSDRLAKLVWEGMP